MAGSLKGPLAKLKRAEAQLGKLRTEIDGVFPRGKRWSVRAEAHRGGLEYRFRLVGDLPSIDPDWPLSTGEIMFNLRASLDYLVYELHQRRFRGDIPPEVESKTQFPIFEREGEFRERGIKWLSQRDQRALRNLQPYVARHDQWRAVRYWLGRLNALHNVDKHRQLHLVAASQNAAKVPDFGPELGFEPHPAWGPVKVGGLVETWTFREPPPRIQPHPGARLEVTIQPEGEYADLTQGFLLPVVLSVRKTIERFADRF